MLKLTKTLKFFDIKDKLLEVVIDNANNNSTLKNELENFMRRSILSVLFLAQQDVEFQFGRDCRLCL